MAVTWNAVVAVSRAVGSRAAEMKPSISDRLSVVPIGVDLPDRRRPEASEGGPLRLLYAGLLKQHQKRIFDVPEIIRETGRRGTPVTLSFAGGGDDEGTLKEACRDLESRGLVRFLGILDREQLADEFGRHDVLLMTSEFEGLPNVLLEAMAHSLVPVVSAVASGIPEVISDGDNGFTAPIGDIGSFADHLQALEQDRGMLAAMAGKARATIEGGPFRVDRMVEGYVRVIDRVAGEAEAGSFDRPRGRIDPPPDLGLSWRHRIPSPLRTLWRRFRGSTADG
jgi:glycosyltransferase involved in cell wall biosynthesis